MPSSTPCSPCSFLQPSDDCAASSNARMLRLGAAIGHWCVVGAPHVGEDDQPVRYPVVHRSTGKEALLDLHPTPPRSAGAYLVHMRDVQRRIAKMHDARAVNVHDVGAGPDGHPFVVRDILDGTTLAALLFERELTARDAIDLFAEIVDVLQTAHAAGVMHGALTPDNVLIAAEDDTGIKLLDWGMAAAIAGAPLGSFADDIYALGLMLDRMLPATPRPPTVIALLSQMLADVPAVRPSIEEIARRLALIDKDLSVLELEHATVANASELPSEMRIPRHLTTSAWRFLMFGIACVAPVLFLSSQFSERGHSSRAIASAAAIPAPPAPERVAPVVEIQSNIEAVPAAKPIVEEPIAKSVKPARVAKTSRRPPAAPPAPTVDRALLQRYQRVGRDLIMLQRQVGYTQTSGLAAEFKSINIQSAVATASGREDAMTTLADLERAIERNRPIKLTEACRDNPLATGCR